MNKLLIEKHLADKINDCYEALGELTIEVSPDKYYEVCQILQTEDDFLFEQLVDLCGVDYMDHPDDFAHRFAVVVHLLSYQNNQRIRLKVFATDDDMPIIASVTKLWAGANWFEREAFDLFGIIFDGHEDLRRILTDYGFAGYPFRKDFPVIGKVETRYDETQGRVVYEPVSIENRTVVPKVFR